MSAPRPARWELLAVSLLLTGLAVTLISLAYRVGVTVDEPSHLLSARLYWEGNDVLKPGDMPPAIKIVGGWVPHLLSIPIPYDNASIWGTQDEWMVSLEMVARMDGPAIHRIFFLSRLPLIVFPLLVCGLLWWWARQLFSPVAAVVIATVFCLSPTVLAHGALFKNDLAASFAYLLFWYRAWVYWQAPSAKSAAWLGVGLLAGILTKMSMLILVPIATAIVLARCCLPPNRHLRRLAAEMLLMAAVAYAGSIAAWQFRISPTSLNEIQGWEANARIPRLVTAAARVFRFVPVPGQLRQGAISLVDSNATGTGVYFLGRVYPRGHPLYFLFALAVKVPVETQFLLVAAIILISLDLVRRQLKAADAFWLLPPLIYFVLASMSSLQLGFRLVLPAFVFLLLWCARACSLLLQRRSTRVLLGALVAALFVQTAIRYPDYIAFFNELAGGPAQGIRYLSDSNLDWGQDLPALADYVRTNRIEKLHLAYFGRDNPFARIPEQQLELIAPPWSRELVKGRTRFAPAPGYYAISATLLTGQLFAPEFRDYFAVFRTMDPVAGAGYSIYVYRVP